MHRKRILKTPFVVTLSVASASIIACNGGADDGGQTGDDQNVTGAPTPSINPPPPRCPYKAPERDSSCFPNNLQCTWEIGAGCTAQYGTCRDGKWDLTNVICNPPPPPVTNCPAERPADRSACDSPGATCTYELGAGCPTVIASCEGGQWSAPIPSCNPPPPQR
jgi:hypothetical protein